MIFCKRFAQLYLLYRRVWKRARMHLVRQAFHQYGRNFIFDPDGHYSFRNIEVGNDVSIGDGAIFLATESKIRIGDKVMFGPRVIIVGGNHNTSFVGRFMYDVREKRPHDDQDVVVEDDVWIGSGVVILKGVRMGRGSIAAAGAVLNRDVMPYTVVGGVPAKLMSLRFRSPEDIFRHERELYPPEKRLNPKFIYSMFDYAKKG